MEEQEVWEDDSSYDEFLENDNSPVEKTFSFADKVQQFSPKVCSYVLVPFLIAGSLHLFIADGGVSDYLSLSKQNKKRMLELKELDDLNVSMRREIELLLSSKELQQRLVREELGVIAEDEYLVVFANRDAK